MPERPVTPTLRFVLSHPAHFLAFGFGVGLIPLGPGTWGTLLAFPLYFALAQIASIPLMIAVVFTGFVAGVWVCGRTGHDLGVHDHSGMVWDEIVAFLFVLLLIPAQPVWQVLAFVLFRVFDILKPPPVRQVDSGMPNGWGVMLDDIVAAIYALLCLMVIREIWQWVSG